MERCRSDDSDHAGVSDSSGASDGAHLAETPNVGVKVESLASIAEPRHHGDGRFERPEVLARVGSPLPIPGNPHVCSPSQVITMRGSR